ncbi:MAG: GAF domain-containing protein [Verrucomicrobia bacterium]|nr:GAF domain-containing protein [Verrucomicrobiota bacterium]MBI3867990.1 GAF domain-containing protein [Verrucomicrobiota bacterium]
MNPISAQLARTTLRITVVHKGDTRQRTFYKTTVILGRCVEGSEPPDLDLSPDQNVSRRQARVEIERDKCWIQDLGSRFGTKVDGGSVPEGIRVQIDASTQIEVGDTFLKIEGPLENASGFAELSAETSQGTTFEIRASAPRSNRAGAVLTSEPPAASTAEALFGRVESIDQLLQAVVVRAVQGIHNAQRGTLLLRNPATQGVLLAAFVSPGEPSVSETLVRRALKEKEAFVWQNRHGSKPSQSIQRHRIRSGMYAPLIYNGTPFGVLSVDNPDCDAAFSQADLEQLVSVADQAAAAVKWGIDREIEGSALVDRTRSTAASLAPDRQRTLRRDCLRALILLADTPRLGA